MFRLLLRKFGRSVRYGLIGWAKRLKSILRIKNSGKLAVFQNKKTKLKEIIIVRFSEA